MGLLDRFRRKSPKRNKDTGNWVERYWKSFNHAIDGIIYTLKYEHNMIIIFVATIIVVGLSFYFKIKAYEWLFLIIVIGGIMCTELINSSIEAAIDLTTTEMHPLAKIAKDTASGATLVLVIVSIIGGLIIFLPRFISLFGGTL